jgi:nitroreductase
MTKDVIAAIEERRSIREFEETPIPDATIGRLIESARLAPSAGNLEPWKFVVVKRDDLKQALASAAFGQNFIGVAPVCIVVCAEPERSAARYGERGANLYCLQDSAAAVQNILLTATAYGLGSCWVGAFDETQVKEILGLAPKYKPVAILPIGYSADEPMEIPRRPLEETTLIM